MSADELEALLLVQEHDTNRDRLRHRRASLPEREQLEANLARLHALGVQTMNLTAQRDEVLAKERRLDDEARTLGARADAENAKLYSGTTNSPRELQAMQADVDMLLRQRSDLEDQELEVMEARETLELQLGVLTADSGAVEAESERLRGIIAEAEGEIDEELGKEDTARDQQASAVSPALLADYERRRAQNRGAGAARLVGTSCTACHLSIPSTEAENIRKGAGEVVAYCDNCGAILVP